MTTSAPSSSSARAGRSSGADIHDPERAAWTRRVPLPDFHPLLTAIEDCSKPVVMALHGTALGGGVEGDGGALGSRSRKRDALPEANLGIIPAEGDAASAAVGRHRKALEIVVSGRPIGALDAFHAGLVDRVVESGGEGGLRQRAVEFALELAESGSPVSRTRDRRDKLGPPESIAGHLTAGRELARKTRRNQSAPLAAIDAIAAAASLPFEEGCARERELSRQCVRSEQCKALIHGFFAERAVSRVPDVPKEMTGGRVGRVAIIGAGTMGGGIAMACANAGLDVILTDATQTALDRGLSAISRNYDASVKRGRLTPDPVEDRPGP